MNNSEKNPSGKFSLMRLLYCRWLLRIDYDTCFHKSQYVIYLEAGPAER